MTLRPVLLLTGLLFVSIFRLSAQEIGLQLHSLRNEFAKDAPATMAKVREMGVHYIEMTDTYGLSFPQFIKLLAQNELSVVSFGTTFEKLASDPQGVVDEARSYGARFIVCYWLPHDDKFTEKNADNAAEVLNEAGKIVARNGMLLCYHPHGYEFSASSSGTVFDYLVSRLESGVVYLQMDVFWVKQAGQEPINLMRKYPTRFVTVHLKDRRHGTPNSSDGKVDVESNVALGSGDVGIADVVQTARELGIQFLFVEDESSRALQQLPESMAYLKSLTFQTRK